MRLSEGKFKARSFVSMLTAFAFVLMALSGIVIFFAPSGRVARDVDWTVLGLERLQWIAIHLWMSLVFIVSVGFHIYFNYKVILFYFRKVSGKLIEVRIEWIAALLLCLFISIGAARNFPLFSPLMTLRDQYKPCGTAGGGHGRGARTPDCEDCRTADTTQPVTTEPAAAQHGRVRGGFGRLTLSQYCDDSSLNVKAALDMLAAEGVSAQPGMNIRDIAAGNGLHPSAIRSILEETGR